MNRTVLLLRPWFFAVIGCLCRYRSAVAGKHSVLFRAFHGHSTYPQASVDANSILSCFYDSLCLPYSPSKLPIIGQPFTYL